MLHTWRVVLQLDPNAIGFFDYVAIGDDVTFGIDDYSRTKRALANWPIITIAKETIKKITEGIVLIVPRILSSSTSARLNGGFGVDIDHGRFERLGNL